MCAPPCHLPDCQAEEKHCGPERVLLQQNWNGSRFDEPTPPQTHTHMAEVANVFGHILSTTPPPKKKKEERCHI